MTVFLPRAVEALLDSHHTQYLSASHLTYEILLLNVPHIILVHCNNLDPATLPPSSMDKTPRDCLTLMDHLVTPSYKKPPLTYVNFPWNTDSPYLKDENGKYHAGYATSTPFEIPKAKTLSFDHFSPKSQIISSHLSMYSS